MTRQCQKETWGKMGREYGKKLLDIIYPRHCPLCNQVLTFGNEIVCKDCMKRQKQVIPPCCMKCGKAIEDVTQEYCDDCCRISKSYKQGFPVFLYEGAIKNALYDFKYKNQREYGAFFAMCIMERYGKQWEKFQIEGLIPVPVHKSKKRQRGYNQAEVLADYLAKELCVPVYPNYLERIVNTNPQKELNDKIRMKNLKNAFKIGQNTIKLKKVLLVDDIYTTGATIEACTKVLLEAGVEEVYYTSVAIGEGYTG